MQNEVVTFGNGLRNDQRASLILQLCQKTRIHKYRDIVSSHIKKIIIRLIVRLSLKYLYIICLIVKLFLCIVKSRASPYTPSENNVEYGFEFIEIF